MTKEHYFPSRVVWTGNTGTGTSSYKAYKRTWNLEVDGKDTVHCSNDPMLGGDPARYNPEDLLISALSACHMLWYLHLCSQSDIVVEAYADHPVGVGESEPSGKGRFLEAILKPEIVLSSGDIEKAHAIHDEIHNYCFIARSVNFPVKIVPQIRFSADKQQATETVLKG